MGPPLPGVEIRVTNDDGELLDNGEIGNLEVRGPNVFLGYWRLPQKNAEDFAEDGFFRTGDNATVDGDGYVSIVGRSKDMIITGGLNVYPKEIEAVIDDLAGVSESAVIGVPHPDLGESVVAVVVGDGESPPGEADLIAACKQQLAGFKVPKRVVFVSQLPRNTMSKVQKNQLREQYSALFDAAAHQNHSH